MIRGFILSLGQSERECGLSININFMVENSDSESICAYSLVKDYINSSGKSIKMIEIDSAL